MPMSRNEPDLLWLADAPVFIDGQQIGAFYDAIVGREFKAVQLKLSAAQTEQLERSAGGSVKAGLSPLFPWLKIDAGVQAGKTRSRGRQAGQTMPTTSTKSPAGRSGGTAGSATPTRRRHRLRDRLVTVRDRWWAVSDRARAGTCGGQRERGGLAAPAPRPPR